MLNDVEARREPTLFGATSGDIEFGSDVSTACKSDEGWRLQIISQTDDAVGRAAGLCSQHICATDQMSSEIVTCWSSGRSGLQCELTTSGMKSVYAIWPRGTLPVRISVEKIFEMK